MSKKRYSSVLGDEENISGKSRTSSVLDTEKKKPQPLPLTPEEKSTTFSSDYLKVNPSELQSNGRAPKLEVEIEKPLQTITNIPNGLDWRDDYKSRINKMQSDFDNYVKENPLSIDNKDIGFVNNNIIPTVAKFNFVNPVKDESNTEGYLGGSVRELGTAFGDVFSGIQDFVNILDDATSGTLGFLITQDPIRRGLQMKYLFSSGEEKKQIGNLVRIEVEKDRATQPLQLIANEWYNSANAYKLMPQTITGEILTGITHVVPLVAELAFVPEVKLSMGGVNYMSKLGTLSAAQGLYQGYKTSESPTIGGQVLDEFKGLGLGYLEGSIFHGMGLTSSDVGGLVNNMSKSAILDKTTSALANGLFFSGFDAAKQYTMTGKIDMRSVYSNFGVGVGLSLPSIASSIRTRAVNNLFNTSEEAIQTANMVSLDPQILREKSIELGVKASETENNNEKGKILTAKNTIDNVLLLQTATKDVIANEETYKKAIKSNKELSTEEETKLLSKIDNVISQNAEILKAKETKPEEVKITTEDGKTKYGDYTLNQEEQTQYNELVTRKGEDYANKFIRTAFEMAPPEKYNVDISAKEIIKNEKEQTKTVLEGTTSGIEEKIGEQTNFDVFKKIALESKDVSDFMKKAREIKNVPTEVANEFFNKYGGGGELSPEKAAEKFIEYVKQEKIGKSAKKIGISERAVLKGSGNTDNANIAKDFNIPEEDLKRNAIPLENNGRKFYTIDQMIGKEKTKLIKIWNGKNWQYAESKKGFGKFSQKDLDRISENFPIKQIVEPKITEEPKNAESNGGIPQEGGQQTQGLVEGTQEPVYLRDNGQNGTNVEKEISIQKKEAAKQKIADGVDGLLSKWGGKQNLTPEERTLLVEDLSNIARGITDLTAQEIKDFIREKIKPLIAKLGISDKDVEDILEESVKPTGIRMKSTEAARKEFGLGDREKLITPSDVELTAKADEAIQKGYNIADLTQRMEDGNLPTALEQRIIRQYLSGLEKQFEANPNDELLSKIKKTIEASDVAGTLLSESFRSRRGEIIRDDSLAGFFVEDMEKIGVDKLTDAQKETIQKEWQEISDLKKKYEDKLLELDAREAKARADKEFKKQRASVSTSTKKTHEAFVAERKEILSSIAKRWKEASMDNTLSALPLPYAKQLAYITPDVAKLMKSYLLEGISTLDEMIKKLTEDIKPIIPDIQEKDVHNLIAGEYNKPSYTKSELVTKLQDLRTQAKLINKLEELESGQEPKIESKKVQRNKEITNLRKQIKENDLTKLAQTKVRMKGEIERLEKELKSGNFAVKSKPKEIKLDKEGLELKDRLIKARQDREIRLLKEKYKNRTKFQKFIDSMLEILNIPRTMMASSDLSAVMRQGVIPTVNHPIIASRAFVEMIKQMKSQKAFDRWLYDLYNSPEYPIMKESGLYISDPRNPELSAKEEQFMNNLAEKIPILGKFIKGSERAYISYLNKMRVDLFKRMAEGYESDGKTIYNSKKLYKETAKLINNETGRGNFGKFEDSAKILNTAFFSPRLIASRVTLLTNAVNPKFYLDTPKEVRVEYMKDMIKFVGVGVSILALAKLAGADVDDDWRSSDFGKIRIGNQRYDIWGGFQSYVRLIGQLSTGETKSTTTGVIKELGTKMGQRSRYDVVLSFARGKLSPVPATVVDVLAGKTMMGEDVTFESKAVNSLMPLIVSDIKSAVYDKGVSGILTAGIPATFGIGVQNYPPAGSYPQESANSMLPVWLDSYVQIGKEKINALGENVNNIDKNAWAIINKEGFNIQPKSQKELKDGGKEFTDEQYAQYLKIRGDILKRELPKYKERSFSHLRAKIKTDLGYNDEKADEAIENIKLEDKDKFAIGVKREADIKAREKVTGKKVRNKNALKSYIDKLNQ